VNTLTYSMELHIASNHIAIIELADGFHKMHFPFIWMGVYSDKWYLVNINTKQKVPICNDKVNAYSNGVKFIQQTSQAGSFMLTLPMGKRLKQFSLLE